MVINVYNYLLLFKLKTIMAQICFLLMFFKISENLIRHCALIIGYNFEL